MENLQDMIQGAWWLLYVWLFGSAIGLFYMGRNAYFAWFLWVHRNTPVHDPVIAEALKDVKPKPFWLYALLWGGASLTSLYLASNMWKAIS